MLQCGLMRGSWTCCSIWTVFNETNGLAEISKLDILHHAPLNSSGIIRTGSVFMSTPKRLLHFSILVRIRRVYYVRTCHVVSYILYDRYNDSSGSMILVRIIVVLQIGATFIAAAGCRSSTFAVPHRDSCVLEWCCGLPLVLLQ